MSQALCGVLAAHPLFDCHCPGSGKRHGLRTTNRSLRPSLQCLSRRVLVRYVAGAASRIAGPNGNETARGSQIRRAASRQSNCKREGEAWRRHALPIRASTPLEPDKYRTPHSGYHFDGTNRRFFEGWYLRVSIPEINQSFTFMYSIEDPGSAPPSSGSAPPPRSKEAIGGMRSIAAADGGPGSSGHRGSGDSGMRGGGKQQDGGGSLEPWQPWGLENTGPLQLLGMIGQGLPGVAGLDGGSQRYPGVGAQVLGPDDEYLCQFEEDVQAFWGSRHELALGNTFRLSKAAARRRPPSGLLSPKSFLSTVDEGFQVSPTFHQGHLRHNGKPSNRLPEWRTVSDVRWEYSVHPIYGWGDVGGEQKATAGWLAALPVFEPHWQVNMAGGLATGWLQWGDRRFDFKDAPAYAEKNWGGSFPVKWFWIQCNVFDGIDDMALTAGGGRRGLPLVPGEFEDVAMVGVHYGGKFYEFVPWAGHVEWEIATWGRWKMAAWTDEYEVELLATTTAPGVTLRAPTAESGLAPMCRDTFFGDLRLTIWRRGRGEVIVDATSSMAGLEVGGGPWWSTWQAAAEYDGALKSLIGLPLGRALEAAPRSLQPPGL